MYEWEDETYHGWVVSKLAANMKDRESERVAFVMYNIRQGLHMYLYATHWLDFAWNRLISCCFRLEIVYSSSVLELILLLCSNYEQIWSITKIELWFWQNMSRCVETWTRLRFVTKRLVYVWLQVLRKSFTRLVRNYIHVNYPPVYICNLYNLSKFYPYEALALA